MPRHYIMPVALFWISLLSLQAVVSGAGFFDGVRSLVSGVKNAVSDKDVQIQVDGHSWTRTIPIEELKEVQEESWCDEMPKNRYNVDAFWKERSVRKVERRNANSRPYTYSGFLDFFAPEQRLAENTQPYTYKGFVDYYGKKGSKADNMWAQASIVPAHEKKRQANEYWEKAEKPACSGDCCPKCHEERKEDLWCKYSTARWVLQSAEKTKEENAYPFWPEVSIKDGKECDKEMGCKRKAKAKETHTVKLTILESELKANKTTECNQDHIEFHKWQLLEVGQKYPAKTRMVYGLLCGSIEIPDAWRKKRIANDGKAYTYGEFLDFYGRQGASKWQTARWEEKQAEL